LEDEPLITLLPSRYQEVPNISGDGVREPKVIKRTVTSRKRIGTSLVLIPLTVVLLAISLISAQPSTTTTTSTTTSPPMSSM
jgi:hypothetical protein